MFWPFNVLVKNFANSRPSSSNFKSFSRSLKHFFLSVGQKNFGNKIPFQSMEYIVFARPYLANIQKALGRSYYYTACDAFWWNNTAFLWSTSHGWWFHCYGVVDLWRQLSPLTHWVTKLRQSVCEHNRAKILLNSYLHFDNMAISQ